MVAAASLDAHTHLGVSGIARIRHFNVCPHNIATHHTRRPRTHKTHTMARWRMALLTILLMNSSASGFTSSRTTTPINIRSNVIMLSAQKQQQHHSEEWTKKFVTSAILVSTLVIGSTTTMPAALADEYGVETEAPTLFTGESVMVCM